MIKKLSVLRSIYLTKPIGCDMINRLYSEPQNTLMLHRTDAVKVVNVRNYLNLSRLVYYHYIRENLRYDGIHN